MRSGAHAMTLVSEMRKQVRDNLIDGVMDAYVDWRQESAEVECAYQRWSIAPSSDPARDFGAYAAALDREELSSRYYAQVIRRTTIVFERDRRRRLAAARHRSRGRRPARRRRGRRARLLRQAGSRAGATARWDRGPVRSDERARSRRR
jgi:hypothetical protein